MFDIGFIELVICAIIALLVLGPERLPVAARTAGRWIGGARRMVNQFTSELDRQLKADELRKELREAGDVGLEDVEKTVRDALNEAKDYEHMILSNEPNRKQRPAPATRRMASDQPPSAPATDTPREDTPPLAEWEVPSPPGHDPHAQVQQPATAPDHPADAASAKPDTSSKDKPERDS